MYIVNDEDDDDDDASAEPYVAVHKKRSEVLLISVTLHSSDEILIYSLCAS